MLFNSSAQALAIRTYVQGHLEDRVSVKSVAAGLSLDPIEVKRVLGPRGGALLRQFVAGCRMEKAAELLSEGVKVEAVMCLVGIHHWSHFVHAFRRSYGCRPGQYRSRDFTDTERTRSQAGPTIV